MSIKMPRHCRLAVSPFSCLFQIIPILLKDPQYLLQLRDRKRAEELLYEVLPTFNIVFFELLVGALAVTTHGSWDLATYSTEYRCSVRFHAVFWHLFVPLLTLDGCC